MHKLKLLVTGGAGYIGSHMVRTLGEGGHEIIAYDNLSTGFGDAVLFGKLIVEDLADREKLDLLFEAERFDAVLHFAAHIVVPESVRDPIKYYRNNFSNALNLVDACVKHGVKNFIFSSTAAVYGAPAEVPISEHSALEPVNPYGSSKLMVERMLRDVSLAADFRYVALRYFNAAGADQKARIGERHDPETHLIPLAVQAALDANKEVRVFGVDYPTKDGTCVRDYIHIDDLIDSHVLALDHLMSEGGSRAFNCGYGHGATVKEVLDTVRKVTGIDFTIVEAGRREGDPPELVADSSLLRRELGWTPAHDDLDFIVRTAWEWEKKIKRR
jgi:UDP-glucose 4-epimerase